MDNLYLIKYASPMGLSSSPGISESTFVLPRAYFSKILKPLLGCAHGDQEGQNLKNAVQEVGGGGRGGERVKGEVKYWKKNAIFKNQINSLTDYYRNYTLFFFLKRLEDTTTIIILQFLMKEYYLQ